MTDEAPHHQRRCNSCREWIDARAVVCYLCGDEKSEERTSAVAAAHAERVNANLFSEGNAAMRDHAATRNIPSRASGVGPQGNAYRGAKGGDALYRHIRQKLKEATGA